MNPKILVSGEAAVEALRSVVYDFVMANYAQQYVGHAETRRRSAVAAQIEGDARYFELERSMFLECFLLHFRNLMEFLHHQRGDRKVLWAGDLTRSKWPTAEAKEIWGRVNRPEPGSRPVMERISTRLSHIGINRLQLDYEWNPPRMYADLRKIILLFRAELPTELRDSLQLADTWPPRDAPSSK